MRAVRVVQDKYLALNQYSEESVEQAYNDSPFRSYDQLPGFAVDSVRCSCEEVSVLENMQSCH